MKKFLLLIVVFFTTILLLAQDAKPVWELSRGKVSSLNFNGKARLSKGAVKLYGTNSFTLPLDVLGDQKDYTIEFDFKRSSNYKNLPRYIGAMCLVSNTDKEKHTGFSLVYLPPAWDLNGGVSNKMGIDVNGYWGGEFHGLTKRESDKITLVVKDRYPTFYRNGLIIAMAEPINPSQKPLTFGGWGWRNSQMGKGRDKPIPEPYEIGNIKIYDSAITPTGYDNSTKRMRNYSGEGYRMQRVDIKDKKLPRILVIGDSQSMGYREFITKHFEGRAYVDYWVGGGWLNPKDIKRADSKTKKSYRGVLANGPYDVVTWNSMTGHMWNYKHQDRCPQESIIPNFSNMVEFFKEEAPDTTFIWLRCTPRRSILPDGTHSVDNPVNDLAVANNKLVDGVMEKYNIPIVDLYTLGVDNLPNVKRGWKDTVHWSKDVYKDFAKVINEEIEKHLPEKHMAEK